MQESLPTISVVMPVYNSEAFLGEMLECLSRQTFECFEVVLVDDGSVDGSGEIALGYARSDGRFVYHRQENAGAGPARNKGIDLARGEWLAFLDSDDLVDPRYLERLYGAAIGGDSDVCVCRADYFSSGTGEPLGQYSPGTRMASGSYFVGDLSESLFQKVTLCPWDKIFRASLVKDHGLRFQALHHSNDAYFVLMCVVFSERISYVDDVLVHHRVEEGSSLRDSMAKYPLCDLQMCDALREDCAGGGLIGKVSPASIDRLCVSTLFWCAVLLASQSEEALGTFLAEFRGGSLPRWLDADPDYPHSASAKERFKASCLKEVSARGFAWAVGIFSRDQLRSAHKKQMAVIYLRLALACLFMRGSA